MGYYDGDYRRRRYDYYRDDRRDDHQDGCRECGSHRPHRHRPYRGWDYDRPYHGWDYDRPYPRNRSLYNGFPRFFQ